MYTLTKIYPLEKIGGLAVSSLVDALNDNNWGMGKLAEKALHKITGQDLYADGLKWKLWLKWKECL